MSVEAIQKAVPGDKRRVTVLGSTGSIGCNTIDLIEREPDHYDVVALTANGNVEKLIEQSKSLRPKRAVIGREELLPQLEAGLSGTGIDCAGGRQAVIDAGALEADWVMAAIMGAAGLAPTLEAVRQGTVVGLANKETLVCAGEVFTKELNDAKATMLPVDSEHNAIFQVFDFDQAERVSRIILTASGGPFRTWAKEDMTDITPEQAVAHPNWSMGAKISVDSATMMNKGLELIEAYHLFPVTSAQIDIVVHPQSVIHSMVEYIDGSVLAQMGTPDMRTPIGYALGWPDRIETPSPKLDFGTLNTLNFETPDLERFPALVCARDALNTGGTAPAILNAANEIAVDAFLKKRIAYLDIVTIVRESMERIANKPLLSLDTVYEADQEARSLAEHLVQATA